MPKLSLGLSPNITKSGTFDRDAIIYFSRAGVTDATAKQQINAFVAGVKGLGLWNNMVCWPLRSAQNKGSGTTAYSLGGLGTYNASLNASPTWNTSGITTNGTSQWMDAIIPTSSTWSFCPVIARTNNSDTEPRYYWGMYYSAQISSLAGATYYLKDGGLGIFQSENNANNWSPGRPAANATTNFGFQSVAYSETGPSANVSLDGSFSAQTGVRNLAAVRQDRVVFGRRAADATAYAAATHAFYGYFNSQLSNSVVESIRSLYKTTLGTGLGLP
jgi:hypothetical protein